MKKYEKQEFDFSKWGAFFAFSTEQFEQQKKQGVEYEGLDGGLICPKGTGQALWQAFKEHTQKESQKRLEIEGIEQIIRYELANHEVYYTGELDSVDWLIEEFGTTKEQIREIYNKYKKEDFDDFN